MQFPADREPLGMRGVLPSPIFGFGQIGAKTTGFAAAKPSAAQIIPDAAGRDYRSIARCRTETGEGRSLVGSSAHASRRLAKPVELPVIKHGAGEGSGAPKTGAPQKSSSCRAYLSGV
jgi:hypothetical protein